MAALRFPKFASSDVAAREWETRAGKKKPVTEIKNKLGTIFSALIDSSRGALLFVKNPAMKG